MIDIAKLQVLLSESDTATDFFNYLSGRTRNRKDISTAQAMRATGRSNTEIIRLFRQLSDLELGSFKQSRRGGISRFEWAVQMIDAARAALGEADSIEALSDAEADEPTIEEEEDACIDHLFYLRLDMPPITMSLPPDLTAKEAERLSQFIRSLPIED